MSIFSNDDTCINIVILVKYQGLIIIFVSFIVYNIDGFLSLESSYLAEQNKGIHCLFFIFVLVVSLHRLSIF
jgi:hypothetical protein